jgi:hypothetical protein
MANNVSETRESQTRTGPEADRLRLDGNWEDRVREMLTVAPTEPLLEDEAATELPGTPGGWRNVVVQGTYGLLGRIGLGRYLPHRFRSGRDNR